MANLTLLDELDLVTNAGTVGRYLNAAMRDALAGHDHVGEVRGEGMLCAVELVKDKAERTFFEPSEGIGVKVAAAMAGLGVIGRAMPQSDIIGFAPPLCLTQDEADIIVSATKDAVESVLGAGGA